MTASILYIPVSYTHLDVYKRQHLFNFLEIAAQLREAGALSEVENAVQLADKVAALLNEPSEIRRMSQAGLSVLKANQGALERLLEGLQRLL